MVVVEDDATVVVDEIVVRIFVVVDGGAWVVDDDVDGSIIDKVISVTIVPYGALTIKFKTAKNDESHLILDILSRQKLKIGCRNSFVTIMFEFLQSILLFAKANKMFFFTLNCPK